MGIEGILIAIVIIIVVVAFYGSQLSNFFNYYINQGYINLANQQTDKALQITPKSGQQVCTLKVVFKPFISANVVPPIYVRIDNGASSINWSSCHSATPSVADLLPTPDLQLLDLFGFFNPSPSGYKFQATLVTDDGKQTHPIVNPVPAVGLNNNISGVGQSFTLTFVFQNIPRQHYVLQISSDSIGINQAGSGNTYFQEIH